MLQRVAYFYLMSDEIEKIRPLVPAHVRYWKEQAPPAYIGGPFTDRSGGLILFDAESVSEAERRVASDPFVIGGVLSSHWIKAWSPETP